MKKPSMIATAAPLNIIPYAVQYTVHNPTSTSATFKLTYSVDSGQTWLEPRNDTFKVSGNTQASTTVNLPFDKPVMFRINMTAGNAKVSCYLDDIKLYYQGTWGPEFVTGDVNGDGEINIADVNSMIDLILNDEIGDLSIEVVDVNSDGEINISDVNVLIGLITD